MEETKEEPTDANSEKPNGNENFLWEEWTVIDEEENSKNCSTTPQVKSSSASSDTSYSDIDNTSDAEEARECIQVLSEVIGEECPSVRSSDESLDQHNEESDGVSVITESDVDERAGDANDREVVLYNEKLSSAPVERPEANADRILMKVLNVMIACSLVAVIGLGAGRVLNLDDNRTTTTTTTELDIVSMKMESSKLVEQMKELSGVKEILEEIKSSLLHERVPDATKLWNPTESDEKKLPYLKRQFTTLDSSMNEPDTTLAERLQIFLRTICLVLEDIREPNMVPKSFKSTCGANSLFSDIKKLQLLLNGVLDGMEPSEKSTHQRFLHNIGFQMNSMSDSLVSDMTRALDKLSAKNQKRLEKIGFKLNERLCILRNTLSSDSKLRESLEKNNTFLDNCEDIATKKIDERSKEKRRGDSPKSQPPKVEKRESKKREAPSIPYFNKKPRRFPLKRQNATSPYDSIETKKCYSNSLPSFLNESPDSDDTCAILMAPPRSNWKLKNKSAKAESGKSRKDKRKKILSDEWPGNILLKGDRGPSRVWKKKASKDAESPKCHKTGVSSSEYDDMKTEKTIKERKHEKPRSGAILSEPPTTNPDAKHKRINPSARRMMKNFEKENNEFIVVERRGEDAKIQSNWQFESCQDENDSDVKDTGDVVVIKDRPMLEPKPSVEIIEKTEVENIEIAIFLERITSLFGRITKKLELAAALPILLEDPETLKMLTAAEMKVVQSALNYQEPKSTKPFVKSKNSHISLYSVDKSIMSFDSTCRSDVSNLKIYEALKILNSYSAIREKVKSSQRKIAPQCHLFLQHMKYYIEHCALRIRVTPVQAKSREVHFRKLWHENREAQKDIAALMALLDTQRSKHCDLMETIDSQFQKDSGMVEKLNRQCAEDIKSTVIRSERKQIIEHKTSEMRQNDLNQYLAMAKNKLEIIRETNSRLEQDVRSKRFKVSSQLLGQIAKYDAEVGARNAILEQLTEEFITDKRSKEELQEKMAHQSDIYNAFVEEREQTNLTIFREKLEKFVRTRAVKIIQRWWRPIFKRLQLKKKKKRKTKKGKKK